MAEKQNPYTTSENLEKYPFIRGMVEMGIEPHVPWDTVYKYTSVETAKIILNNNTLRFSSPVLFDDSFELSVDFFDFSLKMSHVRKILISSYLKNFPNHTIKQAKENVRRLSLNDIKETYKRLLLDQRKTTLVLCSSQVYDNHLMWSLYGDKNKGVCIGFTMQTIIEKLNMFTMNVHYPETINPKPYFTDDPNGRTYSIFYWMYTKLKEWKYQEEVRTIILNTDNKLQICDDKLFEDVELQKEQICEIYYGVNTTDKDIMDIEKILIDKRRNIKIKAKMYHDKFELKAQPR